MLAGMELARGIRGGQAVGRILTEKAIRFQEESNISGRHYQAVFGSRNMSMSERIPENNICVLYGTICSSPFDQPVAAAALIRIVACGVSFLLTIRCTPNVMVDKASALAPPRVGRGKGNVIGPAGRAKVTT
jgi:hypothetical protein